MIVNFRKVFEFLFKSFDIAWDTKLIEKLEHDGVRFLMLIKRHWMYGVLHSLKAILMIVIAFINAYLLIFSPEGSSSILSKVIGIFLLLNIFYWSIVLVKYLINVYKIRGNEPQIEDIYTCLKKSQESDIIFTKFFNQTLLILIILVWITFFTLFMAWSWLIFNNWNQFGINFLNVVLLIAQWMFFYSYLINMINLEMDFTIAREWNLLFYNQNGFFMESQNMNARKIKTMNGWYSWFLGSFFNYGSITILSEWDQSGDKWQMKLTYIGNPNKTIKDMQKILNNDIEALEKEINIILKRILTRLWIDNIRLPDSKQKLKKYLEKNENSFQELYNAWNQETKNEIKEIYQIINT